MYIYIYMFIYIYIYIHKLSHTHGGVTCLSLLYIRMQKHTHIHARAINHSGGAAFTTCTCESMYTCEYVYMPFPMIICTHAVNQSHINLNTYCNQSFWRRVFHCGGEAPL